MTLSVNIDTIQKLSDILLSDKARLVNLGSRPRDGFDVVTLQGELILHALAFRDGDTFKHSHASYTLLTQKVSDFNELSSVLDRDVDWEMSID